MEKGKNGISGGTLIIIMILCIALGMAPGYIFGNKLLDKEETIESKEETKKETKKKEEKKKEETKTEENNNVDKVIDLSDICNDNTKKCEEEITISNNEITDTIKIITDGTSKEMTINGDSALYDTNNTSFKQIALLDNNILVIETETPGTNGNTLTRYYLSENFTILYENTQLDLREGKFKEEITAKEFTSYKNSLTCGKDGIKQSIYKVKLLSSDQIETELIETKDKVYVAQC